MKPYPKLRGAMQERDIRNMDLAALLGRSRSYVSQRMTAKEYFWDIHEIYAILAYLEIPLDRVFEYFPPKGGIIDPKRRADA